MPRFPFPPAFRLRRKKEYDRVFREGRKRSSPQATVVAAPNGLDHPRLGILAGKALGGAVVRNRIKRVFREAFRLGRETLPAGHDFVVIPRPRQKGWDFATASAALQRLAAEAAEACRRAREAGAGGQD